MKIKIISVVAIVLLATTSAWAADVAGKWTAHVPAVQGQAESDITMNFKVTDGKLTGTLNNSAQPGDVEIKDGKIAGDDVSFSLVRSIGGADTTVVWKGKISGDEIKFTRGTQAAATAAAPAAAPRGGGAGATVEVVAKRVK